MAGLGPLNHFGLRTPLRISLAKKLFLGFVFMVLMTLLVGGYALYNLNVLRGISEGIVEGDIPNSGAVDSMVENLLAQDVYEKRFSVFKDPAIKSLFEERGMEFREALEEYRKTPSLKTEDPDEIKNLHEIYEEWSRKKMDLLEREKLPEALAISDGVLKDTMDKLMKHLRGILRDIKKSQNEKIRYTYQIGEKAFFVTVFLCIVSGVFGLGFAGFLIYNLTTSIRRLKEATRFIGEGQFDRISAIRDSKDEVGDLTESFQWMTNRLKVLGELNLDANPLTRLPGNLAIEKAILTRLQSERRFAFCLIDLDNFKAFSDRYGYARGSEVLKAVGHILVDTVKRLGDETDFVGHIGGDDFVLITDYEKIQKFCESIICQFDEKIPGFYDPEDRKRGFIISKDRKDMEQSFPIMTVSIAVVTNEKRILSSPGKMAEIAAQLKQYAKTFPKSIYVVDQRRSP